MSCRPRRASGRPGQGSLSLPHANRWPGRVNACGSQVAARRAVLPALSQGSPARLVPPEPSPNAAPARARGRCPVRRISGSATRRTPLTPRTMRATSAPIVERSSKTESGTVAASSRNLTTPHRAEGPRRGQQPTPGQRWVSQGRETRRAPWQAAMGVEGSCPAGKPLAEAWQLHRWVRGADRPLESSVKAGQRPGSIELLGNLGDRTHCSPRQQCGTRDPGDQAELRATLRQTDGEGGQLHVVVRPRDYPGLGCRTRASLARRGEKARGGGRFRRGTCGASGTGGGFRPALRLFRLGPVRCAWSVCDELQRWLPRRRGGARPDPPEGPPALHSTA
jgi:hypothetical protein